jgi:hypothetical protein
MMEDLDSLLRNWPFEPGTIQVRMVDGRDGRAKIQLRLDLGVLQMEVSGRPDGQTPFGCESLLDHFERLCVRFEQEEKSDLFRLTAEDCLRLQQEGIQYYHRYLAFFQLQNYESVIRDTKRNLRLFEFVTKHADKQEMASMFQQFRPYVLMMLARAQGMLALQNKDYNLALKHIAKGIQDIRNFLQEHFPPELIEQSAELNFLQNWEKEIQDQRPLTPREKLQQQMLDAVEQEDYERAARLRDALKELS